MEYINKRIVKTIVGNSDDNKHKFLTEYSITEADLLDFEFPGYNAPELRKSLNDFLGPSTILRHDNGEDGRHIAPYNVDITSVIAINLVCDVIEGSYQVNTKQSIQAEQGYILYSFSPAAPPGYLIVESPINPVYMRCHNRFLTRINFRLTDQSNNLIDLQEEELVVTLFVIKDFPPCIRVEEELTVIKDNGQGCIVLPRGLRLILIKVDSSFEEMGQNTVLVCRCDSSEISLPSICKGHFTASMDDSDYTLQEIVDQFSVPKTVTFNKLNLKDFISISELDNDRLFNALSGPVEIEAVENIESYIGCEHQTSVNIKYNIVVLPTFLNPSVHLPKDVVNTNKLLKEYFVKPTVKLVTFIESNLFSFGSVSRVPIYLRFPGSEKSAVKDDLTNNENETNLSCPLYDSPSASTLPGKPLCSKDTGPHPTRIITRKEGVRRRIVQAEQSMQRLSVTEPVLATTIDNKQRVGYEGQRSVDPGAGKQLELYPGNSRQVLQNADKPQLMSGYTALFRDVDDYDMAAEDTNVYEPIDINDDEYEYVSVPQETSSLTSPSEVKEDATDLPVTGSPGYGCYAVLPRENSVGITPTYENVDKNQITVNKETVASGDQPKHSTLDLNYTSQKAALYENVT
ncbi:hypothetical protein ACJMK2_040769 [Sinanodonta woodiana]|uniref:CABIT domain-containing protein n=1 Tax=Sinanodonta woodiana TaxID=1069815 RepID=A0ABD3W230_SINWO